MHDAIIFAAPLLIGAIVLALRFVGCSFQPGAAVQDYSEIVLGTTGLVSFWRLNEQSGTTAADSKDGNPGTYENGVTLGGPSLIHSDTDNFAASFDGTTQFVSVPFAANINPEKFTVEAIVNPSAIDTANHVIVCSRSDDAANNQFGYIMFLAGNEFRARVADGASAGASVIVPADAMANGGPYYVAMTYDGTTLSLFVNAIDTFNPGNPGETVQQQASIPTGYAPNTIADLLVGAANIPAPGPRLFFPGVIQDVAIYDQALDFSTIQAHFFAIMGGG